MKKTITAALVLALAAPLAADAQELDVTANAGWVSEYHYRGIFQKASSASAGLDLGVSGAYLGTWAADVGDGNEVDLYAGYGLEYEGFSVSAGGTGYFYTGDFDETYLEGNLGAGYGPISVEFSFGTYDTDPDEQSYTFLGITAAEAGFYATYGLFGGDDEFYAEGGDYAEAGYGFAAADLDFSVAWVYSRDELVGALDEEDHTLVLGVSKTFGLME